MRCRSYGAWVVVVGPEFYKYVAPTDLAGSNPSIKGDSFQVLAVEKTARRSTRRFGWIHRA
jgi:hypothetical protein